MENRRILTVIHPYYQRGFEGFAAEMLAAGCIVAIGENEQAYGIHLKGWNFFLTRIFGRAAFWFPRVLQMKKIIQNHDISKIHFVGEPTYLANIAILFAIYLSGRRIDYSCRCAQNMPFIIPFPFNFSVWLLRVTNAKVYPVSLKSQYYCENFLKINPMTVLPNGVPSYFYDDNSKVVKSNPRRNILFVGSFFWRKGILDFCNLASKMTNENFIAIGGGVPKHELEEIRIKFPFVKFVDRVSMAELVNYYDEAKIVIVPSRVTDGGDLPGIRRFIKVPWSEQFCRVIIEAYARGCEVVAYDSGAISSVIRDEKYLVEEGNQEQLYHKVKILINDQVNQTELVKYSTKYTWKNIVSQFLKMR